ncbi:uncharacterized protein V1518DRAFT_416740 [Limtongia smithiae]|uniref:uncharacterized protein n=1 Tax=Limtongia smithiae TaxID=1125753 RepID=UPI0034CF3F50
MSSASASGSDEPGGMNIRVVVRVRPFNNRERAKHAECIVQMENNRTIITTPDDISRSKSAKSKAEKSKEFVFDKSYWSFDKGSDSYASQTTIFDDLGMPLLDNAFKGFNNCIFAYGQTGSGKSYSMLGTREDPGIIPQICNNIFERIKQYSKTTKHDTFTVEVSYLEIYNERVRDLLNPKNKSSLRVREHPILGPYVEDLSRLAVASFADIEELMNEGNKARTVAATNMNETSSRSHAVFGITLTRKSHDDETNLDSEKVSRISLVDLAGSERASSANTTGVRLREGGEINKSLSALGRVIRGLADLSSGKQLDAVIPYRDSALTWLLKDSLGGNSMTAMVATISPADVNFDETISTLRYADSAKRIKNHAVINEDPNAKLIRELKEELANLRSQLEAAGEAKADSSSATVDDFSYTTPDGITKFVSRTEIADQLRASEKLLNETNQTWEERLLATQEIQKQREAALEEMGISVEKGFVGVHAPKNVPYLVNLSDDPLLAECLVYNIKPGRTRVGNADSLTTAQVRLYGSKILQDHCAFENENNQVTIIPNENAAVMVNGARLKKPRMLVSGDRVILGDFHIFRFNNPQEAMIERHRSRNSSSAALLQQGMKPSSVLSDSKSDHSERDSSVASDYVDFPSFDPVPTSQTATPSKEDQIGAWSLARLEAAKAYLGPDAAINISSLNDEELDKLFDEMQKVRSIRKQRPTSSLFTFEEDTDSNTNWSSPPNVSHMSYYGQDDPFVVDSSRTPSIAGTAAGYIGHTPNSANLMAKLDRVRSDVISRLERAERGAADNMSRSPSQSLRMIEKGSPQQFFSLPSPPRAFFYKRSAILSDDEIRVARRVVSHWREQGSLRMIDAMYKHALLLKEAQIVSNELEQGLRFQYTIVDDCFGSASPYDLVLNDAEPEEDEALISALKPCVAVRIDDFKSCTIRVVSLERLEQHVKSMRNVYNESPAYSHLDVTSVPPFISDMFTRQFSYVGNAFVPMIGVLHGHGSEFSCDIVSPYTFGVIGLVKISLDLMGGDDGDEPSSFGIVAHLDRIAGFSEREFSEVHVQMFLPGSNGSEYPGGISASQTVRVVEDHPIVFDSFHGINIGTMYAKNVQNGLESSMLQIKVFARVTTTHLEKFQSWDDMQEANTPTRISRIEAALDAAGGGGLQTQQYDAFVKIQVLEPGEDGMYAPVEIVRTSRDDKGVFSFHTGIQKRILLSITHSSGDNFDWFDISKISVCDVRLIDVTSGNLHNARNGVDVVELRIIGRPKTIANVDGTRTVRITGQWDLSAHNSTFLDRPTGDKSRIVMSVKWQVPVPSVSSPIEFKTNLVAAMLGRSGRATSRLSMMMGSQQVTHSYIALFQVQLRPFTAADSRSLSIKGAYISGEEFLGTWRPRGTSMVEQYYAAQRQRHNKQDVDNTVAVLGYTRLREFEKVAPGAMIQPNTRQSELLLRILSAWVPKRRGLADVNADGDKRVMTRSGVKMSLLEGKQAETKYVADVRQCQRSVVIIKEGQAWMPDSLMQTWDRMHLELRRPYLHIFDLYGEELYAVNITDCRIGYKPELAPALTRPHVFTVTAGSGTHLISVKTRTELNEWVMKIGQVFPTTTTSDADHREE